MKVGIGIPTYNRLEKLKTVIKSIEGYADVPYELFIAIDGSDDGTFGWLNGRYECVIRSRQGVCYAKNEILRRFRDYDYIFIIEDDTVILKSGVFGLYIEAMQKFGLQHINFLVPNQRSIIEEKTIDGLTLQFSRLVGGCFAVYTKEVIEKVGAFNPKFKGYGYGHCEHTLRIARAGITAPWGRFAHLKNAEGYIEHEGGHVSSAEETTREKEKNGKVLDETKKDKGLVYIPL